MEKCYLKGKVQTTEWIKFWYGNQKGLFDDYVVDSVDQMGKSSRRDAWLAKKTIGEDDR